SEYGQGRSGVLQKLELDEQQLIDSTIHGAEMSQDGKQVFLASSHITRYRLEGEDLIFEEMGGRIDHDLRAQFTLSRDARLAATGGPLVGRHLAEAFDAQKLRENPMLLELKQRPKGFAVNPKSGEIYVSTAGGVSIFSPRGNAIGEIAESNLNLYRVY